MSNYFAGISELEYKKLKEAIALIVVLIAGADGNIDQDEREWAKKIAKIRTYSGPDILHEFYAEVGEHFEQHVDELIYELPNDVEQRSAIISGKLNALNPIMAKMDQSIGAILYNSYKSLAEHVAKASGGFLRMWSVSQEESKWVDLPMIDAIDFPEIVDDEE